MGEEMLLLQTDEFIQVIDPKKPIDIYIEGVSRKIRGPGGWGALLQQEQLECEISGGSESTKSNRMELIAIMSSLRILMDGTPVKIHSHSRYIKDSINKSLKDWNLNGWKTEDGQDILNKDLWVQVNSVFQKHQIDWIWEKAHKCKKIDRAKSLATRAIPTLPINQKPAQETNVKGRKKKKSKNDNDENNNENHNEINNNTFNNINYDQNNEDENEENLQGNPDGLQYFEGHENMEPLAFQNPKQFIPNDILKPKVSNVPHSVVDLPIDINWKDSFIYDPPPKQKKKTKKKEKNLTNQNKRNNQTI